MSDSVSAMESGVCDNFQNSTIDTYQLCQKQEDNESLEEIVFGMPVNIWNQKRHIQI